MKMEAGYFHYVYICSCWNGCVINLRKVTRKVEKHLCFWVRWPAERHLPKRVFLDKELVLWSVAQLRPKERLGKVLMNPDYNDFQKRFNGCARDGNSENKDGHLQWCLLRLLLRWALKLCSVQSDVNLGHGNSSPPPRIATLFLLFVTCFSGWVFETGDSWWNWWPQIHLTLWYLWAREEFQLHFFSSVCPLNLWPVYRPHDWFTVSLMVQSQTPLLPQLLFEAFVFYI